MRGAKASVSMPRRSPPSIFCEDVPSTDLVFRAGPVGIAQLGFFPHECPRARPPPPPVPLDPPAPPLPADFDRVDGEQR